jgi:methyl coenzyme M reductase gamma subunit
MARPSEYKPEYAAVARKLCTLGATDVELADFLGCSDRTIYRWQAQFPEFARAMKAGKEAADDRVERSLYHRATGYTYEAEEVFQFQGEIVRTTVRKHIPPDATAMIFWLKNRRPAEWRDVHRIEHTHRIENLSDDELVRIAAGRSPGIAAPAEDPPVAN